VVPDVRQQGIVAPVRHDGIELLADSLEQHVMRIEPEPEVND
jgi:hypothetical protein